MNRASPVSPDSHPAAAGGDLSGISRQDLLHRFQSVRSASLKMCAPLKPDDFVVQPSTFVSPPRWNLAHTSWFFAENVIGPFGGPRSEDDERYRFVFNSYYVSLGPRLERGRRGFVSRPTTEEVYRYRKTVDERMERLIEEVPRDRYEAFASLVILGLHHEQQHQELFYTEIKYILAGNPAQIREAYCPAVQDSKIPEKGDETAPGCAFIPFSGGLVEIGNLEGGWCWDNELPVHKRYLYAFELASRPVTNREFLEFVDDGAYHNQLLWLDNGWYRAAEEQWEAPLYWEREGRDWQLWTLGGTRQLDPEEPVCHVSFYEADAFARWKGETYSKMREVRIPTEFEWEYAARLSGPDSSRANFLDSGRLRPRRCRSGKEISGMLGDTWEWTSSHYEAYPGFKPFAGPLHEYNGKFMDNQRVLRGGSCVSERDHVRISYRNFWAPETRFQFTGMRLARAL